MDTINLVVNAVNDFYYEITKDENARYKSWEYCYSHFYNARKDSNVDYDYLSLQLSFYLASWGMYRGSSFLLQKDYRIHIDAVKEILTEKYNPLLGITYIDLMKSENKKLLEDLSVWLNDYYNKIRETVKGKNIATKVSDTLVTKILMGTLGCVPAYDRYFTDGIKLRKVASGSYNSNSINNLIKFYQDNNDRLENCRQKLKIGNITYPQMKVLDMAFWQIGKDAKDKNKSQIIC